MKTLNRIVDTLLHTVMAVSSLILFVVAFMQVIFRFILKSPLAWSQDVIRLCFAYLIFFGAAYCVREKMHLNIDVILTSLKPKAKLSLEIIINLIMLAFFAFLLVYGIRFTQSGASQLASYLPIKMSIYYTSVPISAFLMFYYLAQQVVEQILILTGKKEGVTDK